MDNLKEIIDNLTDIQINFLFDSAHEEAQTTSGDITPSQAVRLSEINKQLSKLVYEQVKQNLPVEHNEKDLPYYNSLLARAKKEINEDIKNGIVPKDINNFGDLHDFVDANYYGGICEDNYITSKDLVRENKLQDELSQWLKDGRK